MLVDTAQVKSITLGSASDLGVIPILHQHGGLSASAEATIPNADKSLNPQSNAIANLGS